MIRKIMQRLKFYTTVRFIPYLYLNHFCKNVIRTDQSHVIPYRGAVLDLEPGARLYLGGGDLELGCERLKGSKTETLVRLRRNAVWSIEGGCQISYGSTVEVLSGAMLDTQFFTMNSGSVLIAAKKICLGHDVMIGRGVVVYDSDHHAVRNSSGEIRNPDAPVIIGDHVWLATNVTVLKGTTIGAGSMAAAGMTVRGTVPANTLCQGDKLRPDYGTWSREHPRISE